MSIYKYSDFSLWSFMVNYVLCRHILDHSEKQSIKNISKGIKETLFTSILTAPSTRTVSA